MNDDENYFSNFILEKQMQKIYEKFLLNFYKIHLEKLIYKVHAPSIQWKLEANENNEWDYLMKKPIQETEQILL